MAIQLVDAGYTGENFATKIKATIGAAVEVKRVAWRSVDDYGKIASENSTAIYKFAFTALLLKRF